MRDESGMTVAELVMTIPIFLIVFTSIGMIVQVAVHNQDRVAKRVAVNQRARPELTRLMDQLHSGCVAPGVAPIQAGSTGDSLIFTSKAGLAVSPTPDKHVFTLSGGTLSESVYPATGGSAPTWDYSPTPASTRQLLTGVSASNPPLFRYYDYEGGQVSTTPLPTPLSAADAATAVQVSVQFTYSTGAGTDPNAPITLSDSATLRLEPASEDTSEVNLPCV